MSCIGPSTFFGDCSCDSGGGFITPPGGDPNYIYFGSYIDGDGGLVYVNTTSTGAPQTCLLDAPANAFYRVTPGSSFIMSVFFGAGVILNAGHTYKLPTPNAGGTGGPGAFAYLMIRADAIGH